MVLMCSWGHTVALNIDVEQRELAHLINQEAYALGRMRGYRPVDR